MIEKLLENWLDSASERSYQAVFVQMLSAMKYRVVHTTRHTALEFGKDILAVAPDDVGCAYQLKGNPGGKLGLSQYRSEVLPQLLQLISQPVVFPGFPPGAHRAYLVSNGFFEEEVHRSVDDLNRGPFASKVHLIGRGDLLQWAKELGPSLWPSELTDVRSLIELVMAQADDLLPTEALADLLGKVLSNDPARGGKVGEDEFHRRVTSAALLTGIATSHFAEANNNFAVASAWGLLAILIIGAAGKHRQPLDGATLATVRLAEDVALGALIELWEEVSARKHFVEGNGMTDPEVHGWRYGLLMSVLACLGIAHDDLSLLDDVSARELQKWLVKRHTGVDLWGEAALVYLVPWLLYIRRHDPTVRPDQEIALLTEISIQRNQRDRPSPLPNPYYGFEEVARMRAGFDKGRTDGIRMETFAGASYTAEPLLHLLVRTNLKRKCQIEWADFTRLGHRGLATAVDWHYCLYKVRAGLDETRMYPFTYEWSRLKSEATDASLPPIPSALSSRSWLLAFWWVVAPHRFNASTCRYLAGKLIPGWGT